MHIGIDLGGTKIEAVVLSGAGDILLRRRVATPAGDYPAILTAIADLVAAVEAEIGRCQSVGVGAPGSPSLRDGTLKNSNSTCLNGRYLQRDLEAALARPVRIANDANCFALSEAADGAGAGAGIVFGVILGTGVGGGVVVNGQLLAGASGIGSEWGHNLLPGIGTLFEDQQRRCYCGNHNCIETYLSGPGLVRSYRAAAGGERVPRDLAPPEIVERATRGEALATATLQLYRRQLACALSQVINILDPDVIVLGGGLSNISSLYTALPDQWTPWVFSDTVAVELRRAHFGDSSGVRGAARLWLQP